MQQLALPGWLCCSRICCFHAGAVPKDDLGGDFLSSSGLVTSSEEYYPTVAINALMRALRDPAMSSHHSQVVRSLFAIFQALQLAAVPFLPKASMLPACLTLTLTFSACGVSSIARWFAQSDFAAATDYFPKGCQYWVPYHHTMTAARLQVCQQLHDALEPRDVD